MFLNRMHCIVFPVHDTLTVPNFVPWLLNPLGQVVESLDEEQGVPGEDAENVRRGALNEEKKGDCERLSGCGT